MTDHTTRANNGVMGRPKAETVRDHFIGFRVTAVEKFAFLEKARRSGVDATDYARARVLRGIARKRVSGRHDDGGSPELAQAFQQVWHELRRIGVNLNQIARHCNRHQVPPPAEFHQLVAALLTLMQRLVRS